MKKKIGLLLLTLTMALSGCSRSSGGDASPVIQQEETQSSQSVMAAQQVMQEEKENGGGMHLQYVDGSLYYAVLTPNEDSAKRAVAVFRKTGEQEEEIFSLYGQEERRMDVMAVDGRHNLYLFFFQPDKNCYSVTRLDENQQEVYQTELSFQPEPGEYLRWAQAAEDGQVLAVSSLGKCVALDENGSQSKVSDTAWYQNKLSVEKCGLVNTGGQELYSYYFEQGKLHIERYQPENGSWEKEKSISLPEEENTSGQDIWCSVYSGGEDGLLLASDKKLWKLHPASGELTACFAFQDSYVNLQSEQVQFAAQTPEGEYFLMLYDQARAKQSFVMVKHQEPSELMPKQEIVLGGLEGYEYPEEVIIAYNSSQQKYHLVQEIYKTPIELKVALAQGKGPDILNMNRMSVEELSAKGILADLTPLMGEDSQIHPEDLLPSVRETCTLDGGIRFLYPNFYIGCMVMEQGNAVDGGISTEDFLNMGKEKDTYLINMTGIMTHEWVLSRFLNDVGAYVDWENRSCSFDSPEFISILNGIITLEEPESDYGMLPESDLSPAAALRAKEYLVYDTVIHNMKVYLDLLEAFEGYGDITGYPTHTGEAQYQMINNQPLGINSASANQEGAWDFIEYTLISAEEESSDPFSVLQDKFEKQLFPDFDPEAPRYNQYLDETLPGRSAVTEEQAEGMRNIIAHSVWRNPIGNAEIRSIIMEETPYFFEGDKTAEDVAEIIQSRVTLLLNE